MRALVSSYTSSWVLPVPNTRSYLNCLRTPLRGLYSASSPSSPTSVQPALPVATHERLSPSISRLIFTAFRTRCCKALLTLTGHSAGSKAKPRCSFNHQQWRCDFPRAEVAS